MLFVGDDWAEDHHDVEIVQEAGTVLARRRLPEGVAGVEGLHALIADHLGDDDGPGDVVVGIETDRGPWVQALIAAGYQVFAINPLQAARYRERHGVSGAKSDPGDAHVLAELVRLDRDHHRPVAGDAVAEHVKVLARTHQGLVWSRQRQTNTLRSMLREFYPAALVAFGDDLAGRDALAVLAVAPAPAAGRALTQAKVEKTLRAAGRQRNLAATAAAILAVLRTDQLPARPGMVDAYAASARALVAVITALVAQTQVLQAEVEAGFGRHPDVKIYRSQPGLGAILGARVLAVTRHVRNRRLADALYQQALSALNNSPGARAYYDAQRARKVGHHQALRALSNRLVGILHGCLRHHTPYDETRLGTPTPRSTSRCLTLTTVGCLAPMHAS